ncbi:MAG: AlbA family DNA-binding domain-containing protein [Candidatus Limnocylindria bacterium]
MFGAPWDELDVSHVRAFLASAIDEGINWEAKGDDAKGPCRSHSVRKAVCAFANSHLGGFIIVGAVHDGGAGGWSLPGLRRPPSGSLADWLTETIRSGVEPWTSPLIKTWPGPEGPIAVVRIDPVALPPAITVVWRITVH